MGSIDLAADATSGWQVFDPDAPALSPELRQLHESSQRPELGSVRVTVYDLAKGGSVVSVGGHGASTVKLIGAAIAELQEARRIFAAEGSSTGNDIPVGSRPSRAGPPLPEPRDLAAYPQRFVSEAAPAGSLALGSLAAANARTRLENRSPPSHRRPPRRRGAVEAPRQG